MPPHHHHHQNPHCCSCCCCSSGGGGGSCCCSSTTSLSPPPLAGSDQLLQLLVTHLLHQSPPPPLPPLTNPYHPPPKSQPPLFYSHQTHLHKDQHQHQHPDPPPQIHSLLRRVAALESSLYNPSSPRRPASPLQPSAPPAPPSYPPAPASLRDLAARTIQYHFRRFLVRRSQALRHLKQLAALKSHSAALKSSLSDKAHANPKAILKTAMDLLGELDSIQSGDPMIREGKRSISRELTRILEFTDKVLVREQQLSLEAMDIAAGGGGNVRAAEDGGLQPTKTGKRVSFGENGRKSRDSAAAHGPSSQEEDMAGEIGDLNDRLQRLSREMRDYSRVVLEETGEEAAYTEEPEDWELNDVEKSLYMNQEGLSAPLPVQMEPRRGGGSKKKVVTC